MRHSTERILSSHGGSLPRPEDLDELVAAGADSSAAIAARLPSAVQEVVDHQIAVGVDIINDGEYVKAAIGGFGGYMQHRVSGFETLPIDPARPPVFAGVGERDRRQFPGVYASGLWLSGSGGPLRPGFFKPVAPVPATTQRVCTGPVTYVGQDAIAKDIAALQAALAARSDSDVDGFVAALGPLGIGAAARNDYYPSGEEFMAAVAETARAEYKAITDAGLIVQIDEPQFATSWMFFPDMSIAEYRSYLASCVEIINYALEGIPEDKIRFHFCWGSGHRPHVNDIEVKEIADLLVQINAQAYSLEAANVRHGHEWRVWDDVKLPEGRILVPGVISHATDLVEHPEFVAERLVNFASVVGKENLHAGTDCGIGYRVGHAEVAWAKLAAMAEGCRIASKKLFGRSA